ncbi:hypothetical protein DFH06DRAFT_319559 [Mycena polygramma]|nr:hypothetical protein DFH06DRAFT_319559 [Mycena polygramma]
MASMKTLPSELVSAIFINCVDGRREREWYEGEGPGLRRRDAPPLLLGEICRAWRSIAWSTPELWNAIQLYCPYDVHDAVPLLDRWLSRAGDLPLTIELKYEVYPDTSSDGLLRLLKRHAGQLQNLTLTIPPEDFFRFARVVGPLPRLKKIYLACRRIGDYNGVVTAFKASPELQDVRFLAKFTPYNIDLPWEQLTNFKVDTPLWLPECLLVFSLAQNLVTCHMEHRQSERPLVVVPPLLHLKSLILRGWDDEDSSTSVLAHLTTPALVYLEAGDLDVDDWCAFLARSRCSLEHLIFTATKWTSAMYERGLDQLLSLSALGLRRVGPSIYHFVRLLHAQPRFLPNLKVLEDDIDTGDVPYSCLQNGGELAELVVDMLEARRGSTENARLEKFELWVTKGLVGSPQLSQRVKALVNDGMDIGIMGSDFEPMWLE